MTHLLFETAKIDVRDERCGHILIYYALSVSILTRLTLNKTQNSYSLYHPIEIGIPILKYLQRNKHK